MEAAMMQQDLQLYTPFKYTHNGGMKPNLRMQMAMHMCVSKTNNARLSGRAQTRHSDLPTNRTQCARIATILEVHQARGGVICLIEGPTGKSPNKHVP